ncbi:MAG TPA: hypothetical protein VF575_05330 [Candidatus Saccharimonadales bacterium]|jgi:hypothetical protein
MFLSTENAPQIRQFGIEHTGTLKHSPIATRVGVAVVFLANDSEAIYYDNNMAEMQDAQASCISSAGVEVYTRAQLCVDGEHPDDDIGGRISSIMPRSEAGTIMVIQSGVLYAAVHHIAQKLRVLQDTSKYPEEAIAAMLSNRMMDGRKIDYIVSETFDNNMRQTDVTFCKVGSAARAPRASRVSLPQNV